jgi:hypothetical protein
MSFADLISYSSISIPMMFFFPSLIASLFLLAINISLLCYYYYYYFTTVDRIFTDFFSEGLFRKAAINLIKRFKSSKETLIKSCPIPEKVI